MPEPDSYSHIITDFAQGFDALDKSWDAARLQYLDRKNVNFFPIQEYTFTSKKEDKPQFESELRRFGGKQPLHIGIAGMANLEMMYAEQASAAVLFDINPNQRVMWDRVFEIVRNNPDRQEALRELRSLDLMMLTPSPEDKMVEGMSHAQRWEDPHTDSEYTNVRTDAYQEQWYFRRELEPLGNNPSCWLGSDERYAYIREMILRNAIATVTLDALDVAQMEALKKHIDGRLYERSRDIPLVFYLSNLCAQIGPGSDWLSRSIADPKKQLAKALTPFSDATVVTHNYSTPEILSYSEFSRGLTAEEIWR